MFVPEPSDAGFSLLKAAIADYLVADLPDAPSITQPIIDEGMLTEETPTPTIVLSQVGDGSTRAGRTLSRMLIYVTHRGDVYTASILAHEIRKKINKTSLIREYITLDPSQGYPIVEHVGASGLGASVSLPTWKCNAIPLYVFIRTVGGDNQPEWSIYY